MSSETFISLVLIYVITQVVIVFLVRDALNKMRQLVKNTLAVNVGYTVEGSEIVFTTAPAKGATVTVDYTSEE